MGYYRDAPPGLSGLERRDRELREGQTRVSFWKLNQF
ncbi:hypothetical protein SBA1_300010 [Candidatus Sulfotelmatobacter kueseliae]|uniref:Uncharacterized protein n=1 Tax=Candidatus Sulfotelmatobacter kueseliae TaxID=2042962 RepID=A0A2U3KLD3_9BACT|nr:hypothetical protein SBA1_300010 [Candidatus Sulfotelmatobacter kueseliae]